MYCPSPTLSRSNSLRADTPERPSTPTRPGVLRRASSQSQRPGMGRRESSTGIKNMATLGLLAAQAAVVSAAPFRSSSPGFEIQRTGSPQLDVQRVLSPQPRTHTRLEEDMGAVANMLKRDADGVDWSKIDYSGVDYSGVNWATINYGEPATATDAPAAAGTPTPSFYLDQALTTMQTKAAQATPLTNAQIDGGSQQPLVAPAAPAAVSTTTAAAAQAQATQAAALTGTVPMASNIDYFAGIDASQNAISIVWHGTEAQTFNFYADEAAFQPQFGDAFKSITVQPNTYQTVQLPNGFSGRVQKMTGRIDEPATWPEVTFNGWKDLTFFDVSYIRGYNGPIVMKMADNSALAGTQEDFMGEAPDDDKGTSSTGQPYLKATEGFDGSTTSDLISFYRGKIPTDLAYVRNFDNSASKGSACKHLIVSAW